MTGVELDKLEMKKAIKQRFKGKYPKKPKNEKGDLQYIKEHLDELIINFDNYNKNYGFTHQRDPLAADLQYHGTFKDFYKKYKKYYI